MRLALLAATLLASPLLASPATAQDLPPANPLPIDADAPDAGTAADLALGDPALAAQMDRIEQALRLPAGARALGDYARYYAWADADATKVTGILLLGPAPGRKWVNFDTLPTAMAPGCAVVELVFDVPRNAVDAAYCLG